MRSLFVDLGNSRAKFGVADLAPGSIRWTRRWSQALPLDSIDDALHEVDAVRICSVGDEQQVEAVVADLARRLPSIAPIRFRSTSRAADIVNGYADPARLGADRLAAAIGARLHVATGSVIIATFGTATTIDRLDGDDRFVGGVILPGPALMARSLRDATAALPVIEIDGHRAADWPADTAAAIGEGIVRAQLGAVERCLALEPSATLILSGGAAAALSTRLAQPHHVVDHLVLDGLARVATWQPTEPSLTPLR